MIRGSCLCGGVTYSITGKVSDIVHCHCIKCRKAHGSAFSSVASISLDNFSLKGEVNLKSFESSKGKHRFFCSTCGTQIYAKRDDKQNIILRLGSLDTNFPGEERAHTWISEGAEWYDLNKELTQYDEGFPKTQANNKLRR